MLLSVVVCSTRPGRASRPVADWFLEQARAHGRFELELADLVDFALPVFDEPGHPRLGQYQHEHTKRWSAAVDRADAFVFVTPEYNHAPPAPLVNALDFLAREWAYKPAAFVSYGGVSGGLRGVQITKQILVGLKMMPIPEAVVIPSFPEFLDREAGRFAPPDRHAKAAAGMLDELHRWAGALATLRG